jgi:hypothetical protein
MKLKWSMVGLKELTFFERCLSKCMAQAIARNHHQVLRRISHHHLHFMIRVKKGNQVLKKKKQNLPVWENWTVQFLKLDYSVLAEQKISYLKKMIALHQVPTSMTMMTQMMSMMNKNSWWSLRNS